MRLSRLPLLLALLLIAAASPAAAQRLQLVLREDPGLAPIGGAIVRLLSAGQVVAQALSSEVGRVTLTAPHGGTFDLRIDRIGYQGATIAGIEVPATGMVSRELEVPALRMELPTVVVEAENRCEALRRGGPSTVALWVEIRKALEATVITREQGETPLLIRNFTRETALDGAALRRWFTRSAVERGVPFTAPPVEELIAGGFLAVAGGRATLHGPDAELLVSDWFADNHCYHMVRGDSARIGLAFEPPPDQRLPDISGVLWVDSASSELRSLEFNYRNAPPELQAERVGGRLEFVRLDDGGWIISDWHIRAPRIGPRPPGGGSRVVGYLDLGGLAEAAGDVTDIPTWAMLEGIVHDSVLGGGLAGATVTVPSTGDSIITQFDGRFQLVVQSAGDQEVTVSHPRLGLSGEPTSKTVLLSIGERTGVEFAIPGLDRYVARGCGSSRRNAAVVGLALDESGQPAAGHEVRYWVGPLGGTTVSRSVRVDARGMFALCNLTEGRTITVRLYRDASPLVEESIRLGAGEHRWVEMRAR